MSKPSRKVAPRRRASAARRTRAAKSAATGRTRRKSAASKSGAAVFVAPELHEALEALEALDTSRAMLEVQNEALRDAQAQVEVSRNQLANLFDYAPMPYLTLDRAGIVRNANIAASTLLARSHEHLIGRPFAAFLAAKDHHRLWDHLDRCRREVVPVTAEFDLRRREQDTPLPVMLVTSGSFSDSAWDQFPTAILDLTHRQLAEERRLDLAREAARREEAEAASRAKDEFFSLLAHELRTPLNAVHGWTHLLATERLDEAEKKRAIEVIERNVQAQISIINDMLDTSRIIRGALELRPRPMSLVDVVRTAVDGARMSAELREIHLEAHLDPRAGDVDGDPDRLLQVVSNLLSNAIKFSVRGGEVTVLLERAVGSVAGADHDLGEYARLTVRDFGYGIPAAELSRIFEPFRKGDHTSQRNPSGLGLGLAIVRRLVEMHGGRIRARSDGPDRGSEFVVEFSLATARPDVRPSGASAAPVNSASLRGLRILVADDDADARELVHRLLAAHGARVTTVPTAREAYGTLRHSPPDVLVSDIAMPDEDGLSLIERVRRLPGERGGDTPAIALTAFAGAGDEERVVAAGFQAFLAKPVDPDVLVSVIGSLMVSEPRPHAR